MLEKIKGLLGDVSVLFVHQTGSQIFCDTPRDKDYIVVVDGWNKNFAKFSTDLGDFCCYSREHFCKWATMQLNCHDVIFTQALLFGNTLYGANPIENYNWFDYKRQFVEALAKHCAPRLTGSVFVAKEGQKFCSKTLAYAFLSYFAISNNCTFLAEYQRNLLKTCHDGNLPISFALQLNDDCKKLIA